jgi:3-deoxy-D-manno-octulosonate 8-phosphate phosphatase (KDO 8-P phosphatase)
MKTSTLQEKAAKIKLAIFDVDGVLTDGRLYFDANSNEQKVFYVHDGLGIKMLQDSGVKIAIISSRESSIVTKRMQSLGVEFIYQGQKYKRVAFNNLLNQLNLKPEQVAYVGDDLPDLYLIKTAGLGIAVANAVSVVRENATWCTEKNGGQGAVREVCEFIMQAQGTLDNAIEKYSQ